MVSIIAAMSRNRTIGANGSIPWNIPADMNSFRALTLGHTVIMGRKTFESIGRPLQGRKNIVITRQGDYYAEGILTVGSLAKALQLAGESDEVFICGGGEIYSQAIQFAERIYLTVIDAEIKGDTQFPYIPLHDFRELSRKKLAEVPAADLIILERILPVDKACS